MKLKIGTKLMMGFGICVIITIFLALFNFIQLKSLANDQDEGYSRSADALVAMEMSFMGEKAYRIIADSIINRNEKETRSDWNEFLKEFEKDSVLLDELVDTDEEVAWMEEMDAIYARLITATEKELFPLIFNSSSKGNTYMTSRIKELDEEIDGLIDEVKAPLEKISGSLANESIEADEHFDKTANRVTLVSIILAVAGVIIAASLALVITNGIRNPLNKGVEFANKVANGDLTASITVKSGDEIQDLADALNLTVDKLKVLMRNVVESADQVAASSEELSKTAQGLSEGSQKQASSLEETSSSMEEMANSVEQVSSKAQNQASSVEEVTSSMEELGSSINNVAELSQKVKSGASGAVDSSIGAEKSSEDTMAAMRRIEESSNKIKDIIGVISDIADQTNLLALNASIEAARAGDAGRGFAVVAKEISNLADKSASATKDIADLINETGTNVSGGVDMVNKVDEAIKSIREAAQMSVQLSAEMANATEEQLSGSRQISEAIENVNQLAQSIASSSEEQSSTTEEMSKTVESVNEITQQAASSAEEMASSTEELSSQAESLKTMVGQFKIN